MTQAGLIEKIRGYFSNGESIDSVAEPLQLPLSIADNLRRLLNTRVGSLVAVGDYGIMDIPEIIGKVPSDIGMFEDILSKSIMKYEPRAVKVNFIGWSIVQEKKVLKSAIDIQAFNGRMLQYHITFNGIGRNEVVYIKKYSEMNHG